MKEAEVVMGMLFSINKSFILGGRLWGQDRRNAYGTLSRES